MLAVLAVVRCIKGLLTRRLHRIHSLFKTAATVRIVFLVALIVEVFVLVAFFQLRQSNAQDREHEQRPTRNPLTLVDDKHVDDSHSPGEHAHVQPNSQTQSPIRQRRYPQDYPAGDKCLNTCHCHMIVRNGRFMCAKPRADTDLPAENRLSSIIDWPHICPQNFRNLADYTYAWNSNHHSESISVPPHTEVLDCLRDGAIIYARGWDLDTFFAGLYPVLKHRFVLVTGESDRTVPYPEHRKLLEDPESKIIHWFGQNGDVSYANKPSNIPFTAIPIGLNCKEQSRYLERIVEHAVVERDTSENNFDMTELQHNDPTRLFPLPLVESNNGTAVDKLLLINFDPSTDPTGVRHILWKQGCSSDGAWASFSACFPKESGVAQYADRMAAIYERNLRYPFWLSPRGNGLDCHRTWEALYVGRIPVISSTPIDHLFADLPVVIVKDWSQLSRAFLLDAHARIEERRKRGDYNFEQLSPRFWAGKVLEQSAYAALGLRHEERPGRCWAVV